MNSTLAPRPYRIGCARSLTILLGLVTLSLLGCARHPRAHSPDQRQPGAGTPDKDATAGEAFSTSTTIVTASESLSADELLLRGQAHLDAERYTEAAADFRLVSEMAAHPEERLRALFGWGTALDLGGDPEAALGVYSRYVTEERSIDARDRAQVRVVRLLVYLERYDEARDRAAAIDPNGRAPLERVALAAALSLGALERDELPKAEHEIGRGRMILDQYGFDRASVPPLDVAALYFALGELRRRKAEAILFDPIPPDFAAALEQRCQYVLDAQAAYSEAMRSQDAHWSSMSGVRVGHLYQHLHRDLMSMPKPQAAKTREQQRLFEGAIRLRYSILLRKALSMLEATVALLERAGHQSAWQEEAERSLRDIERAQNEEETAIDALPFSRAQLQQVLDQMAKHGASRASGQM